VRTAEPAIVVEVLSLDHALATVGAVWRGLEDVCPGATFFQGIGWAGVVAAWLRAQDINHSGRNHLVLVAKDRAGTVVGLWPVQCESRFGLQFVVGLGEPFQQYSDVLVLPDADRASVVRAMLLALAALGRFSGVILRKVRDDAAVYPYVERSGQLIGESAAPAVCLTPFADFDSYHATVKAKTRKNLRNARNRLERGGVALEHTVHTDHETVADVARRAFELRSDWLEQEGLSSRAFMNAGFAAFVDELGRSAETDDSPTMIAFELRRGDDMLSLQWGFVHRNRYYAYMAVRNPAFDAQSPGRLHLEDVIRSCAALDLEVVDFLAPDVDYKRTWATEFVTIRDYGLAFTPMGRLVLGGAFGAPRRVARQTFDALPQPLRQAAIKVLARRAD